MTRRWFHIAILVSLVVAGCGAEQEPAANKDATDAAGADAVQTPAADAPQPESSTSLALVAPAADGIPEVRYYSLGGG